jgi:hypothetical protein
MTSVIGHEVAKRLAELKPGVGFLDGYPHYVRDLESNLAPGIERADFAPDFDSGGGRELTGATGEPPKLHAVHSSAALTVNTFAPFRRDPSALSLLGHSGFTAAAFEKQLPTGLGGTPPHLDFYACGAEAIVAVEGKFTETLAPRAADFAESYADAVSELADSRWADMYRSLCSNPRRFRFLGAAQLVKHYLGIRRCLADEPQPKTLLYVFWEPVDWARVPECAQHRYEVLAFSVAVSQADVAFVAMSYAELWDALEEGGDWAGKAEHLAYLRRRYVFELKP